MKLPSPELLERIAQDQKAKRWEKSARGDKKKHLRKRLRNKLFVHSLLRVGMSEELIAYYADGPRSLVHDIVKGWKRTELPKILQERAKNNERAGA